LGCSNEEAVKSAASQITLFDLDMDSLSEEAELVRNGNEWMRQAVCRVYAQNIGNVEVGYTCAERIIRFFDDDSDAVRDQIGVAFWQMNGERLRQSEAMILRYIESKSFESDPEQLLRVLDESRAELPNVIVRAAERIVTIIGDKGSNLQFREASTAHSIATLVVRQFAQTTDPTLKRKCLDLIDQMERSNYMGINDELEKIDR
jgi:Txe/YoeB family toxin of Txe-Axe toxin-antitoxin module